MLHHDAQPRRRAGGAAQFLGLAPLFLVFIVFYFLMIRPQQKGPPPFACQADRRVIMAADIGARPRFVFTSSLAVFGSAVPTVVPEDLATQPESTYGATKAIGELLVNEYSRKGYVDGRVCRLPTISVRPGKPNSAASSSASGRCTAFRAANSPASSPPSNSTPAPRRS